MKTRQSALLALILICCSAYAVKMETVVYAERDTALRMDIFYPDDTLTSRPCLIYAFGGGFTSGARNLPHISALMEQIAERGIVAVAIDYRLGLNDKKFKNPLEAIPVLENSVEIAAEDLLSAAAFLYTNAARFGIDSSLIMASGTSAGAITSLQADYYLHSDNPLAANMPEGFKFAGIMSFAGAVAVFDGKLKYTSQPAPTLFVHGTDDRLVPYDHIVIMGKGMYGSDYLAKLFDKNGWRYEIMLYENFGHEVAWIGIKENIPEMVMFIDRFIKNNGYEAIYPASLDVTHKEKAVTEPLWNVNALDLYKEGIKASVTKDSLLLKRIQN